MTRICLGTSHPRGAPPNWVSAMKLGDFRKVPEEQTCQTASRSDPKFQIHEEVIFGLFLCIGYSSLLLQHCAAVDWRRF